MADGSIRRDSRRYDDDDTEGSAPGGLFRRGLVLLACLVCAAMIAVLLKTFLDRPEPRKTTVQQVALLRQQPPPPPPKPPEKQPEPPKVKEEVKIEQPRNDPTPEPAKGDDKPASDKPLGVDAEGSANSDGFGLAAVKGGRDLLSTGSGRATSYSSQIQRQFHEALSRNRKLLGDEFRVTVKVWIGDDGRVQKAEVIAGTGDAGLDEQIRSTLASMSALRDVPPPSMRPIQLRLSNRA